AESVDPSPPTAPSAAGPPGDLHAGAAGPMTYLAVGLAVPGLAHPDSAALRVLDVAIGHGGVSRLARAVAARGLRGAVQSRYVPYAGAGAFAAIAACPPAAVAAVRAILADELLRLGGEPPDDRELLRAQARHIGTVYRQCESNL